MMVGKSEPTKLVGEVNSDVSVDGTGREELSMVLALVDDSASKLDLEVLASFLVENGTSNSHLCQLKWHPRAFCSQC